MSISSYQTFISEATTYWQSSSIYTQFPTQITDDINNLNTAFSNYMNSTASLQSNFQSILPQIQMFVMIKYNMYTINGSNLSISNPFTNPFDIRQEFSYFNQTLPSYTNFFSEINSTTLNDSVIVDYTTTVNSFLTSDQTTLTSLGTNISNSLSSLGSTLSAIQTGSLQVNFKYFFLNYMQGQSLLNTFSWTLPGIS